MAGLAPSGGPPLGEIAAAQADLLFNLWSNLAREGTLYRGVETAAVWILVAPLPLGVADGAVIWPGDEQVMIRGTDLAGIAEPRAGDYVIETISGLRRDVVAVQVDASRQLWTLVGRKALA